MQGLIFIFSMICLTKIKYKSLFLNNREIVLDLKQIIYIYLTTKNLWWHSLQFISLSHLWIPVLSLVSVYHICVRICLDVASLISTSYITDCSSPELKAKLSTLFLILFCMSSVCPSVYPSVYKLLFFLNLYLIYNDWKASSKTFINISRWHRC